MENPTDEELRRFDRQRKDKRVSNAEWMSPTDQDSRIAKMKDGRTHLAYKAEHVIDLETEVVLAEPIYPADHGDAQTNLTEAGIDVEIEEAVGDKGYHATDNLELAYGLNIRTHIPEPKRKGNGKRNWQGVPEESRRAVVNNRRRTQAARSKRLQRQRSERVERSFCPRLRNGRCSAKLASRDREGPEALLACCGRAQPGVGDAQGVRNRDAERLAGGRRTCFFGLFRLASRS